VQIAGGAEVAQQYLRAGLLEEIMLHVSPVILGSGTRLFEGIGPEEAKLETMEVVESPAVTHIRYRVTR
jgi:dihydrofolate reductase